jgi:hypothetical protein
MIVMLEIRKGTLSSAGFPLTTFKPISGGDNPRNDSVTLG